MHSKVSFPCSASARLCSPAPSMAGILCPLFSPWVPGLAVGAAAGLLALSQPLPDGVGLSDVLHSIPCPGSRYLIKL